MAAVALVAVGWQLLGEWLALLAAGDLPALQARIAATGAWAPAVSFGLMVLQGVIAPLPAFVITLTNAALFGWAAGAALSWSSSLVAAALCFGIARTLGRAAVARVVPEVALAASDRFFDRHGAAAVLLARLVPVVPFDPVSYAAGLTPISWTRFLIATGLGQLPATLAYSYAGATLAAEGLWVLIGGIAAVLLVTAAVALWRRAR